MLSGGDRVYSRLALLLMFISTSLVIFMPCTLYIFTKLYENFAVVCCLIFDTSTIITMASASFVGDADITPSNKGWESGDF